MTRISARSSSSCAGRAAVFGLHGCSPCSPRSCARVHVRAVQGGIEPFFPRARWISMAASAPFMYFASRADAAPPLHLGVASVVLMIGSLFLFEKGRPRPKTLSTASRASSTPWRSSGSGSSPAVGASTAVLDDLGLVCVFGADSGAFYGQEPRRHRLAPRLSPKNEPGRGSRAASARPWSSGTRSSGSTTP
jgi:hypothetical protein